jgi:hypothetical protein
MQHDLSFRAVALVLNIGHIHAACSLLPPSTMSERSSLAITLTVVAGILAYKFHKDRQKPPLVLPPSPKSYPLIGHLLSIPQEFEHLGFMKICEQLGSK